MAAIELRDTTIYFRDGTTGNAVIETAAPDANDTTVDINTVNIPEATTTTAVPIGARFTVNTANNTTTYTVTARDSDTNTTCVTFTPAWGSTGTPAQADVLTFTSQQVEVTVGEGNLTWTETKEYEYVRDRGNLDTVRQGDEQPVEVTLDFTFEHVTAGTGEDITVGDALRQTGNASEWITSSADTCEPYAVDLVVYRCQSCGTTQDDLFTFSDFRWETLEYNVGDATISITGRCNVSTVNAARGDYDECA